MVHAAEGTLQAYLDGEVDSAAARALSEHVAACTACASELEALRRADRQLTAALSVLDGAVPVPALRARAVLARERSGRRRALARVGSWSLAKAAMLLLVLAGASAAAIPDVRRALETTFARVAQLFGASDDRTAAQPGEAVTPPVILPEAEATVSYIRPTDGRIRVLLHAPSGAVEVTVRLVDGVQAKVETATTDGPVRRRSGSGRLELMGLSAGTVMIGIPRGVPNATIEVDGVVRVYKEGSALRTSGPAAEGRGSEVRFIAGS